MIYGPAFLLCFVVGPGLFWLIARRRPTPRRFAVIWAASGAMIGLAFLARYWLVPAYPDSALAGLAVLLPLWLGWILVLALAVLAIRTRDVPFASTVPPSRLARQAPPCPGSGFMPLRW